jgi:hypothetical protein
MSIPTLLQASQKLSALSAAFSAGKSIPLRLHFILSIGNNGGTNAKGSKNLIIYCTMGRARSASHLLSTTKQRVYCKNVSAC